MENMFCSTCSLIHVCTLHFANTPFETVMQWILTFRDAHSACSRSPIKTDSAKHKRQTVSKKGKEWLRHQVWRLSSPTQIIFQLVKSLIFTMWTNTPPITRPCNSAQCGPGWKHGPDDANGHVRSQKSSASCSVAKAVVLQRRVQLPNVSKKIRVDLLRWMNF